MSYSMGDSKFGLSYTTIDGKPYCVFNRNGAFYSFPLENNRVAFGVQNNKLFCNFKDDPILAGKIKEINRFWRLDTSVENGLTNALQAELAAALEEYTLGEPTVAIRCRVCRGYFIVGYGSTGHLRASCMRSSEFCFAPK